MIQPDYTDFIDIDGQRVTIRTIRPEDRHIEAEFVKALSPRSRYHRFHGTLSALSQQMLDHFINPDYPNELALIATILNHNKEQEIGVARYARTKVAGHAEVAIVVADEWQGKGVGTRLLIDLRCLAKQAGFHQVEVCILRENRRMIELARELGFIDSSAESDFATMTLGKEISLDS